MSRRLPEADHLRRELWRIDAALCLTTPLTAYAIALEGKSKRYRDRLAELEQSA